MKKCQKSKIFEPVRKKKNFRTKAQGLPLNIIIIAVIALIVLGVVVYIFYNQIKKTASGFEETRERTQVCQVGFLGDEKCVKESDGCETGWEEVSGRCDGENEICCKKKKAEAS
jgi:hypothetical protein